MNTLGFSAKQFGLVDPRTVRDDCSRFRRDVVKGLAHANSVYIPAGRWPTCAWVLLPREDYDKLDPYSTALQLTIGDARKTNNIGILKNLSVVQARCVTRGLPSADGALYLIELTDGRGVLCNKWFQSPTTAIGYNIRVPGYPQTFYPDTMNGGTSPTATTWTWATMLQDVWERINALSTTSLLGTWPGLPSIPVGTPEGFWFVGVQAWSQLCDVLDYLGMTVACDLTQDSNPFTIVNNGASDAKFGVMTARCDANLEDDLEWIDQGSTRVPKTVKVLFRRRNSVYGTEETVTYRNDSCHQWAMAPGYTVSVAAPTTFASAVGTHHIWSDFTVRYEDHDFDAKDGDAASNPYAADPFNPDDVVAANAIAAERVSQYFDRIYSRTDGYMTRVYAGALPFVTGSQVDAVKYYQDYSGQDRQGWKTKVVRDSGAQR